MSMTARVAAALLAWRVRRPALLALVALAVVVYTVTLVQFHPAFVTTPSRLRRSDLTLVQRRSRNVVPHMAQMRGANGAIYQGPLPEEKNRKKREALERLCFLERDYGMTAVLRKAKRTYCDNATGVDPALGNLSTYTVYDSVRTWTRATVVTNLWIDFRNARVFKQIQNASQDGHNHDPRFQHASVPSYCVCNTTQDQNVPHGVRVWEQIHGDHPLGENDAWENCRTLSNQQELDALRSGTWHPTQTGGLGPPTPSYPVRYIKHNAIIVARRDDHNPFFQLSVALHAWLMMKVLEWTPETTQLVYFDDGLPSPTDEVQRRMLSPVHPVVLGRDLVGSVVQFERALVAPFEYSGPMMRHLDDHEPCGRNQLIRNFRDLVLGKFGVEPVKRDPRSCTITVISRRPYASRMVQRKWLNEDAIVERMRDDYERNTSFYKYGSCRIQAFDFATLSLEKQMQITVESDVIVGMHGAGFANVMWARPETVVIEIFPRLRKRYGYRNLCQFLGCKWFEFRNGTDTGTGDNASDKLLSYADWFAFIDPILQDIVRALEVRVAGTMRRLGDGTNS